MSVTEQGATAVAAGVAAVTVGLFGIAPHALVAAFAGGCIGLLFAREVGKYKAIAVFLGVVFVAAFVGTWIAEAQYAQSMEARNAISGILAAVAHPMLSGLIEQLPSLLRGWAEKLGAKQ
jgi:hypothetical protein